MSSIHITTEGIWMGTTQEVSLDTTAPFYVTSDGEIKASDGNIGGISITSSSIQSTNFGASQGFQLNSDGSAIFRSITISGYATTSQVNNAQSTADSAATSASNAQSTADSASSTASSAESTANTANSTANSVNGTVGTLQSNLFYGGTTEINGGTIRTGTLSADKITTGTLAAGVINTTSLASVFINTSANITSALTVQGATVRATGNLETGDRINHGTSQYIDIGQTTFYIRPDGPASGLQLGSTTTSYIRTNFRPNVDNSFGLGSSGSRWTDVWALDGTINTSDITQKTDVVPATLGLDFIDTLTPIEFKWADGGVRTHLGFSAQDVKQKLIDAKGATQNYAMYVQGSYEPPSEEVDEEGNLIEEIPENFETYGLRPQELIPVLTKAIQELSTQVSDLTARIETLEG